MSSHPLEVSGPPPSKQKRFLQPRFKQVGPIGDGPRIILAAQSGMGKTTAALVLLREFIRIVDLVWLISGTIDVDPAYQTAKQLVRDKYQKEGTDINDPELEPFREDLTTIRQIMATMTKRTQEAAEKGDKYSPAHLILIDDLMAGGNGAGYRYNADIVRLFAAGRHSGAIVILMTQPYKMLDKAARLQATHLGLWRVQETQKMRSSKSFPEGRE